MANSIAPEPGPSSSSDSSTPSSPITTTTSLTPNSSTPPSPSFAELSIKDVSDADRAEAAKFKAEANAAFLSELVCAPCSATNTDACRVLL